MMKHIIYIFLFLTTLTTTLLAQQTPLYSLYMFNDFAANPAVAGTEDYYRAQMNNRYQFVGLENAPTTASLSVNGGLNSLPMGWGTMVYKDSYGIFSKFGAYGAYSYQISIDRRTELSFGLNMGLINYTIDLTQVVALQDEPNLDQTKYTFLRPDATFGMYLKSKDYYAGFSMDQLFQNQLEVIKDTASGKNSALNKVVSHYTIAAGYKYELSYGFDFEPSVVIRKTVSSPVQVEATARLTYDRTAWAGVSLRSGDACALILGYNYRKLIYFGYAYDMTYSQLRKNSFGSHEIMIGLRFNESE